MTFAFRVGVSEKGSATIELSVTGTPGHSSFPPVESVIGILAAAVARLEESPQPALLGNGPESATFQYLAPHVCTLSLVVLILSMSSPPITLTSF